MWYGQKIWWMIYVMYEIDHILVIGITTCMSMSMTTGRSHRSCLYYFVWPACHWITPCKLLYFVAKRVSHRSRSNRWRDDFMKTQWWRSWWWRSWCHAGDEDDHGAPRWRSKELCDIGHIMSLLLFDCIWCLSCFASYLLRTTVVSKMIPYNNFKKVFPLTVHRCEGSLFRSTTWWSGVIDSNVRIQRVLTSLACTDMASEHMRNT